MNILIVGGGGREHALAWKSAQSDQVNQVYVAPGNAGTAGEYKVTNIDIQADAIEELLDFAKASSIDLTIVGPEAPLVAGIVDQFQAAGLACFGPTAAAAQLEASKTFTKDFLKRHAIPTADYQSFDNIDQAMNYLDEVGVPVVVKADGLAAGKGVIVAHELQQAKDAVHDMLADNRFGDAGHRVVIEEFLVGEEFSFIAMIDGENILPLASSQDHKARDEGDLGPNTGGMGAYSPAPRVDDALHQAIMQQVMIPTVKGLAKEDRAFTGFLYAGIMVDPNGTPKVLEFNVRFGDPETQPILFRMKSDLPQLCLAALDQQLDQASVDWDSRFCVGVVMAAGGYPDTYEKNKVIDGLALDITDSKVFHAGTKIEGITIVSNGGRVLCVCALAPTLQAAQELAYRRVDNITWDNMYFRRDIAHRAL